MNVAQETRAERIAKAMYDTGFRARLPVRPNGVLEEELGLEGPCGCTV